MEETEQNPALQNLVPSPIELQDKHPMVSPLNSSEELEPIDPKYEKSRTTKSKRFNSTNVKYKNAANKNGKSSDKMNPLRKWSQCGNIKNNILKKSKGRTLRVHTAGNKKRHMYTGGYSSLNETHAHANTRFVVSSKGKRPALNSKNNSSNQVPINGNFNRIYTPQMNMRKDARRMRKNVSKTKTMATSDIDGKNSTDPIHVSSLNKSNMSTNCYSVKRRQKFRINSAHPNHFNRLSSTGNWMNKNDIERSKFTSLSSKDWKIFSVRESCGNKNSSRVLRNCCSAKKGSQKLHLINHNKRMFNQRKYAFNNARHIDDTMLQSTKADKLIKYPHSTKNCSSQGINSAFSNSFMNAMFRDSSLGVAQRQKETILRDQRNKLQKEMRRKQYILETQKKISLMNYYKREYKIKVNHKVMESLTIPEFEEYLNKRLQDTKKKKAISILKKHILVYVFRRRFKKKLNERFRAIIFIQKWYRRSWNRVSRKMKRKRLEASKVVAKFLKSYHVFMKHREYLYKLRLQKHFMYFADLRDGLLTKSQRVIRKHWMVTRVRIRARRAEHRAFLAKALRMFTLKIFIRAKKNIEIINHFRKKRRTPAHRSWSCRSIGKSNPNKDDVNKRSIRKKLREYGLPKHNYYRFSDEITYTKDLYEAEKKFMGEGFRRSVSEETLKTKNRLDFRSTFLNLPGAKHLLKEIKVIEEIQKRPKGNTLEDEYEYKNLPKCSVSEITQRVCGRYYKRKYDYIGTQEMPLFGWIYSETVGWTKKRKQLKLNKYDYKIRQQEVLSKMKNTINSKHNNSYSQANSNNMNRTISPSGKNHTSSFNS
ncbi:unnamed protein product [Moneuplotes crassus]|uniref:Uncharacterized protein n=1 Tax=Euplotes crassus TaxID=5936 RepID=A0AAD1Y5J4_EUPCR|nr:unnamed protein product [Moneuplotes crassus]